MYKERKSGRFLIKLFVLLSLIAVLLGSIYYFMAKYSIKNVIVEGNLHYSSEEIEEIVMD